MNKLAALLLFACSSILMEAKTPDFPVEKKSLQSLHNKTNQNVLLQSKSKKFDSKRNRKKAIIIPKLHVTILASSENSAGLPNLLQTTQKHLIRSYVVGIANGVISPFQGLLTHLQTFKPDDVMLVVNAKNAFFSCDKDKILQRFLAMNKPVVFAASKNPPKIGLYPIVLYPISPTIFQYLDSTGFIGRIRDLTTIIKRIVETQPATVLDMYNLDFLSHQDYYSIDHRCKIFLPVYNVLATDIIMNKRLHSIYLKTTNTEPLILLSTNPKRSLVDTVREYFHEE